MKLTYIYSLKDLNQKSAEIESTPIARDMRTKLKFPVTYEIMDMILSPYFISDKEWSLMNDCFDSISPLIKDISAVPLDKPLLEPVNVQRAISMLSSIEPNLSNNIGYAIGLRQNKEKMLRDFVAALNMLRTQVHPYSLAEANKAFNDVFTSILRSDNFLFNAEGLVDEGQVKTIVSLHESMTLGYFFHKTLEDELKKLEFSKIKHKFPDDLVKQSDDFTKRIASIKSGFEAAYIHNMRMLEMALILYACLKVARG